MIYICKWHVTLKLNKPYEKGTCHYMYSFPVTQMFKPFGLMISSDCTLGKHSRLEVFNVLNDLISLFYVYLPTVWKALPCEFGVNFLLVWNYVSNVMISSCFNNFNICLKPRTMSFCLYKITPSPSLTAQ